MRKVRAVALTVALVCSGAVGVARPAAAAPVSCIDDYGSDYNGDGSADLAVADPYATVGQVSQAGQVIILYGAPGRHYGVGGTAVISQQSAGVPGAPEAGDSFGSTLASGDLDCDGFSDLVVGVPYEDAGVRRNAGVVSVLYGSAGGLGRGRPVRQVDHATFGVEAAADDRFGSALDLRQNVNPGGSKGSDDYALAIGVPGRDVRGATDAGAVAVLHTDAKTGLSRAQLLVQGVGGTAGSAQAGDRFGSAVALGNLTGGLDLAVGAPGEDLPGAADAGQVTLLTSAGSADFTTSDTIDQRVAGIDETPRAGDGFGTSLDIAAAANFRLHFVIGIPGRDVAGVPDAGAVALLESSDTEGPYAYGTVTQASPGVSGRAEAGDRFGERVAVSREGEGRILVGLAHEDGSQRDSGALQVITQRGRPFGDTSFTQNTPGVPGVSQAGDHLGESFALIIDARSGSYAIGVPDDATATTGMVEVIPTDGTQPYALIPGVDGVPGSGARRFGAAIASSGREFPTAEGQ